MIILVDNKDYMIKLCKDSMEMHGFDTSYPNWQGCMALVSDMGMLAAVSGPEAEKYLDEKNIYYLHIEDEGETYLEFLSKLSKAISDNEELLERNNSFGKLVYSLTEDLEKGSIETDNILEIWRCNEDDEYYLDITLHDELRELPTYVLKSVCDTLLDKAMHDLAPKMTTETLAKKLNKLESKFDGDYDTLFSAKSLSKLLVNLAKILKDVYTGEYTGD